MAPPKKRRQKVKRSITLDNDVAEAVDSTAAAQRTNFSALTNCTLAERFLGDQSRDPHEEESSDE